MADAWADALPDSAAAPTTAEAAPAAAPQGDAWSDALPDGVAQPAATATPQKPSLLAEAYNPIINAGTGALNALHSAANRVERGLGLSSAEADTAEQAKRVAAQQSAEQAHPSSAAPQIGNIGSVEDAARWALSTTGSLGAAVIQLGTMGIPRAAALAALQGFEETKDKTGDTGKALLSAGVEAAGTAVPLHLLGNVVGGSLGKTALTAAGMGGTNVATEAAQRALQDREGMTPGEAADTFARGVGMVGLHAGASRLINGRPVAETPPPPEPEAPPQLALPAPGGGPMTDEQIAQAQARARVEGKPVTPETPDKIAVTPGGTAHIPDRIGKPEIDLIAQQLGIDPAAVDAMLPAQQETLLQKAMAQKEAQDAADARGAVRVTDTSGEGPTNAPSAPTRESPGQGQYENLGTKPLEPDVTATGTSDRPFRADSTDNTTAEQQAEFERQARDKAEAARQASMDDLEREWKERRDAKEGQRARYADAQDRYADADATSKPAAQDTDGRYPVDGDGFVASTKGGPIRFMSQKEAARWIVKEGHAKSPDQVFEVENHPGTKGGFTVRERERVPPEPQAGEPGTMLPPPAEAAKPAPEAPPAPEQPAKSSRKAAKAPPAAPAAEGPFDPLDHAQRIQHIVDNTKIPLKPGPVAKALGITTENALKALRWLAGRPDSGVRTTKVRLKDPKNPRKGQIGGELRREPTKLGPADLVQHLTRDGGIYESEAGELKDHQAFTPKAGYLVRPKGSVDKNGRPAKSLEEARRAAQEAGYLPKDDPNAPSQSTYSDLVDAIRETNFGKRRFADRDATEVAQEREASGADRDRHDMEQRADELGIERDPKMKADELRQKIYDAEARHASEQAQSARGQHEEELGDAWEPDERNHQTGSDLPFDEGEDPFTGVAESKPRGIPRDGNRDARAADQQSESQRDDQSRAAQGDRDVRPDGEARDAGAVREGNKPDVIGKSNDKTKSFQVFAKLTRRIGQQAKAARGWVLAKGRETGHEYLAAYDEKTGEVIAASTSHEPAASEIGASLLGRMRDPNNQITLHHNHPRGTALSDVDLALFAYPGMHKIVAHMPNGDISSATLTPGLKALLDSKGGAYRNGFAKWMDGLYQLAKMVFDEHYLAGYSEHLINHNINEIINQALARTGMIDYVSTREMRGGYDPQTLDVYRKLVAAIAGAQKENGIPIKDRADEPAVQVSDRPARPLRQEDGIARVLGEGEALGSERPGSDLGNQAGLGGIGVSGEAPQRVAESAKATRDREESYPRETQDSINRWSGARDDRPILQKIKEAISGIGKGNFDSLYQKFIDRRFSPSEREAIRQEHFTPDQLNAEGHLNASSSAHTAAMFADRSASFVESALHQGPAQFDGRGTKNVQWTDAAGRQTDGMLGVLRPIGQRGLWREFGAYTRMIRAQRLHAEGRDKQFDPARDVPAMRDLEQRYPFFRDVHNELQRFNKAQLQLLVQTGRKTQAEVDDWSKHNDYTPFYRELLDESGVKGPSHVDSLVNDRSFRKLTGGDAQIGEYLGNLVRNMQSITAVGLRNVAAQRYIRDAVLTGEAVKVTGNPIKLESAPNVVRVYENGKAAYYRVDNKLTFNALQGLDGHPLNPFLQFLGMPAQVLRTMTTHAPLFLAWNHPMRESMQAWFVNKTFVPPILSAVRGISEVMRNSDLTKDLKAHGVGGGFDLHGGQDSASRAIRKEYAKEATGIAGSIRRVWQHYERLIDAADLGVRTQIYQAEMKRLGNTPGAEYEAAAASLRNAVNFKQRGSSEAVRWATIAIPFLNARVQGLDTLGRAMFNKNRAKQTFTKALGLAALTAGYYSWVASNPLYQRATDQQKDENWLIPVGDTMVRMPAPFEIGILFKRMPERLLRLAAGDDLLRDTRGALNQAVLDTLKFNPIPQALLPGVEAATNHSFYTGRSIVGGQMEHLSPAMQYNAQTSEAAKAAGAVADISPQKIDHVLKGYFGTLGGYVLAATDALVHGVQGGPSRPATGATGLPGISSLVKTAGNQGSDQVTKFYEMKTEVDHLVADLKQLRTDPEAYKARLEEGKNLLQVQGYTKNVGAALSKLHKSETAIRGSMTLSSEAKQQQLQQIDAQRQQMLRNVQDMRRRAYQ